MLSVLLEVYYGIDPKFDACIDASLKHQNDPLSYLVELKIVFNTHACNIEKTLTRARGGGGGGGASQNDSSLRELAKIFFSPFKSHVQYAIHTVRLIRDTVKCLSLRFLCN